MEGVHPGADGHERLVVERAQAPWWYDEPYRSINRDYLKLKMRLTPYMYGLVHEAAQTGAPPVRGLMWDHPRDPHAQDETYKYQFLLGRDLLVAPVYRNQAASRGWRRDIHLPAGGWIDYWDGRRVQAGADGRQLDRQVDLATLPVFVRAGAILPMYPSMLFDGEKPLDEVTFDLYPQGDSQYTLYEDDGNTRRYQQVSRARSRSACRRRRRAVARCRCRSIRAGPVQRPAGPAPLRPARTQPAGTTFGAGRWPRAAGAGRCGSVQQRQRRLVLRCQGAPRHAACAYRHPGHPPAAAAAAGLAVAAAAADDAYPAAPVLGRELPADSLLVVNRPAEEPGHALENAFDDDPATWFRSVRNQAVRTGAHEWVIGFGERKMIDGIDIAPRTDKNWKHGQVRDYARCTWATATVSGASRSPAAACS